MLVLGVLMPGVLLMGISMPGCSRLVLPLEVVWLENLLFVGC